MYEIPTSIVIEEQSFTIRNRGDFRMVLDCFSVLEDIDLSKRERVLASLVIFYEDINTLQDIIKFPNIEEAVRKMYEFFNCGKLAEDNKRPFRLVDWENDSQLICAAVNKVAGKEIRLEPYIHWWTFMAWYMGINDSILTTIIGIRDKISRGKTLEKHEREFRLRNPQYFKWDSRTLEQIEDDALINNLWNSGK